MYKNVFCDRFGAAWAFRDYRLIDDGLQPLPVGDRAAEYRAFIAEDGEQLLIYKFIDLSSRAVAPNVLEGQLLFAKAAGRAAPLIRAMRASGEFQVIPDEEPPRHGTTRSKE